MLTNNVTLMIKCCYIHIFSIKYIRFPFSRSPNIGKMRVKVRPKTIFPILRAPAPTEFKLSLIISTKMHQIKCQIKVCPRFSFFQIFFEQSVFDCFHAQ